VETKLIEKTMALFCPTKDAPDRYSSGAPYQQVIQVIINFGRLMTLLTMLNNCDGEREIDDSEEGMPRQAIFDIPGP